MKVCGARGERLADLLRHGLALARWGEELLVLGDDGVEELVRDGGQGALVSAATGRNGSPTPSSSSVAATSRLSSSPPTISPASTSWRSCAHSSTSSACAPSPAARVRLSRLASSSSSRKTYSASTELCQTHCKTTLSTSLPAPIWEKYSVSLSRWRNVDIHLWLCLASPGGPGERSS